jgi:Leucine-rich repeat (LRR) protein
MNIFKHNNALQELSICNNELRSSDLDAIFNGIQLNMTLKKLDMSGNKLNSNTKIKIEEYIKQSLRVEILI